MQTESECQISDINLRISNATLAFTWEHDANRYEKLHHSITSMLKEAENALSAVQLVTTTTYCHGLLGHLDKVSQSCGRLHGVTWWCEISSAALIKKLCGPSLQRNNQVQHVRRFLLRWLLNMHVYQHDKRNHKNAYQGWRSLSS